MRTVIFSILCIVFAGQIATAGAWLREEGKTFNSTSFVINRALESANTSYLEHGLSEKMTIGVDIGQFRKPTALPKGFTTIFIRRAIGRRDARNKLAYELGIGTGWTGLAFTPHIKTGLNFGRGIKLRKLGGWLAVDASVTWDLSDARHVTKLDTTLGLDIDERWSGMLQVYLSRSDDQTFTTLAPSVIFSPRNSKFKFQVGAEKPMHDGALPSLKLGLWSEF